MQSKFSVDEYLKCNFGSADAMNDAVAEVLGWRNSEQQNMQIAKLAMVHKCVAIIRVDVTKEHVLALSVIQDLLRMLDPTKDYRIGIKDKVDQRIGQLHEIALSECRKIEKLIDEIKALGPHSHGSENALANTREHLAQLSRR
jgi:hypothetical protein